MVNFFQGNLMIFTIGMLFMFSTAYTIVFYYNQASSVATDTLIESLDETENKASTDNSILSAITSGFVDSILGFLAIINPFGLVIILLKTMTPTDLFTFLDLLILRPIGWAGTILTSNYVISKIRGVQE